MFPISRTFPGHDVFFKACANQVEELFSPNFVVSLLLCQSQVTIKPLDQFTLRKLDDLVKWPI